MHLDDKPMLGISLGTRILGIAVVRGKELLFWKTKRWKNRWTPQKCALLVAYIDSVMSRYNVAAIGIKVPPRGHFSHGLLELISELAKSGAIHQLPMKTYRIQELKKRCSETSLNRDGMMRCIITRFDFLQSHYLKEQSNKTSYHVKMFEAILAALCMTDDINSIRRRKVPPFFGDM